MNHLPAEVYYGIFYHLSRPEIQICSFVCRRLNDAAIQVYNKELIIDDYKVQLARFNLASDTADTYFKNGQLVQKVIIKSKFKDVIERLPGENSQSYFHFSRKEFLLLLKYLPNIEEIDLTESGNFTYYISFLIDADLQYIKKITALPFESCYGTSDYLQYLSVCFKFCNTLTSLYLEYTEDTMDYTCSGVGILDMLSQFKNLKQLVFYNNYRDNLMMFRIQKLYPQLRDLTFMTGSNCHRSSNVLERGAYEKGAEPTVELNKSLRRLNINLLLLSIDYTKHLTSYLTDTLHTVNIQVAYHELYDWIDEVGMENSLTLMKKLGKLNDVCISFRSPSTDLTHKLKMSKWFQVVNAFKGSKKALCTVKFCGTSSSQDYFKYNALDGQLVLAYVLEDEDYHGLENEIQDVYNEIDRREREDIYNYDREDEDYYRRHDYGPIYSTNESLQGFPLPTSSISTIGPEIIDCFELNLDKASDSFIMRFLKYVFTNCINLQCLKVTDYLLIRGYKNQRNKELKMVHFLNGIPTYNIFNVIIKYLPDIEVLVLGSRSRYNSNLDLRPFKSLKRCYIVVQQTSNDKCEALNIKFEYTDGKKQWYYYDGTVKKTLVRQDTQNTIYLCRSLTFTCKNDIEFNICFGTDKSLLNFDIDKPLDSCCRIPMNFI